jgi:putative ABC transport system substrate-binding protein
VARSFIDIGGLMSYGASLTDTWRQVGIYAGRRRREASGPAGRSVDEVRTYHHTETARMLGLEVPATLLARADEVIE